MAVETWKVALAEKQAEVNTSLPKEWRLPQTTIDETKTNPTKGVMDIPRECGLLTEKELDITENYDAVDLIKQMAERTLTSYDVTLAFCKRAAIAQQLTGCLTEMFFDKALDRAKELDKYIEKHGKPMGPFHGLPISVKDRFHVKGTHATIGFISYIKNGQSEFNSVLIDLLFSQGAVFYVKTNVPQTMMAGDSVNNIFGRALCPHNLDLSAGGSSGGEGALVAMRGSPLGVGTDIGGSIRIPALCNGTFGFKPTPKRIPYGRTVGAGRPGSPGILPVAGPLANSVRDLRYFMEQVIRAEPWEMDSTAQVIPWRATKDMKVLKVGLILEDPDIKVSPPIKRALNEAANKLRAAGHSVTLLEKFQSFKEQTELCLDLFGLDPNKTAYKKITCSGEPPIRAVAEMFEGPYSRGQKDINDVFDLNVRKAKAISDWYGVFRDGAFDVLLSPGHMTPSTPHNAFGIPNYTMLWNLDEAPAAIIPYLTAERQLTRVIPLSTIVDTPSLFNESPTHVQIVGKPGFDEELVDAVTVISNVLKA
ncbi:hypothetical protein CEP54_016245 [Fusarium duplospermum]|uniref:amidase n=1 Tax=Fusarium duplospermum TaxID=1325734 RepID=A0A428NGB4_9HYPO|nr:hypothetical protein CEP54_016245 [Fusarium duplospermum]